MEADADAPPFTLHGVRVTLGYPSQVPRSEGPSGVPSRAATGSHFV